MTVLNYLLSEILFVLVHLVSLRVDLIYFYEYNYLFARVQIVQQCVEMRSVAIGYSDTRDSFRVT